MLKKMSLNPLDEARAMAQSGGAGLQSAFTGHFGLTDAVGLAERQNEVGGFAQAYGLLTGNAGEAVQQVGVHTRNPY